MNSHAANIVKILQGLPVVIDPSCSTEWQEAARIAQAAKGDFGAFESGLLASLNGSAINILNEVTTTAFQAFSGSGNVIVPSGWKLYSLADAYKPRPPAVWIVEGLFKLPSLSCVYGPPGSMKTLILLDMCACVVIGRQWLEPLPGKNTSPRVTTKAPVLWVDFDNGSDEMHERVEAIGKAYGLDESKPFHYVSMPDPWLVSSNFNHESFKELVSKAQSTQAKLIVIDNLGAIADVDENSPAMAKVMSNLRRLAEITGAAVIFIHHQRKSTGSSGRKGETLRGHTSIEAALNLALLVEREENSKTIIMASTKTRGDDVYPFGAIFTFNHKPGTPDLAQARFYGVEIEDLSSEKAIDQAIIDTLRSNEMNQKDLVNSVCSIVEAGQKKVRGRIVILADEGKLKSRTGDKNAVLYSVA